MAAAKSTAKSASKTASRAPATHPAACIQFQLRIIAVELRCALSTISVAAHALCEQNADIDADVALVLQRGAGATVHAGLERIEAMLREIGRQGGGEDASEAGCVH